MLLKCICIGFNFFTMFTIGKVTAFLFCEQYASTF